MSKRPQSFAKRVLKAVKRRLKRIRKKLGMGRKRIRRSFLSAVNHMNKNITVGILSDTHGRLCDEAYAALADCDHIIHAGDICDPGILRALETLAPVTAVLGNNDFPEYGPNVQRFAQVEIGGVRFLVAHYPQDVRISGKGSRALAPGDPIPHIAVHGHTHVPRIETGAEAGLIGLLVCPGSVTRPRKESVRSVAKVFISKGAIQRITIETLKGKVTQEWTAV